MNQLTEERITHHLNKVMDRIIKKRTKDEPFNEEDVIKQNPFGYRLVPIEVWKGSKFERSFVTALGQGIFEQIAKIIAEGTGSKASNQHDTHFTINSWRLEKIEEILSGLRLKRRKPDWENEIKEILLLDNTKYEDVVVKSDLYIKRPDGNEEFYSFKTVKPNLDQTERAKRDMLRLIAANANYQPYFALPFNPAGEGNQYSQAHKMPYKLFDMDSDSSVLIGAALWNKIGNDKNTYNQLINIFDKVGKKYSNMIREDYLGID
ncbi:TdeIII family type II restriction endonuclease [Halalkalibacterium halodurans]|uniref:TdeIII family type II restriction endonuclease n=1 Tax=Halalkalibacterium halodurans TaxID=86665 RepID=UPI002AA96F02|nr:TdeIII family type II restriction endonuclease [Halalkalibacterium halodurans]MDY7224512.1 TdeIII family type II restriction endonuclease [Halalkalibacterium halodurans]MDY7243797.1 TdeIII family type II restriction endonuclease [Halalkalibacterium halodurans]